MAERSLHWRKYTLAKKFKLKSADQAKQEPGAETSSENDGEAVASAAARQNKPRYARDLPVDRIQPNPHQARLSFDGVKLQELANGMKVHGWIGGGVPVRAHSTEANIYELVFGERRWRAAKLAGLTIIPCEVSEYSEDEMIELGLLENVQRENLTNLELGLMYQKLLALQENGKPKYSIRKLAEQLGKDKSHVEDMLQYARAPEDVQALAEEISTVPARIVRELAHIEAPEDRAPIIEAVRAGQVDIEDVRAVRKQIPPAEQEVEVTNEEPGEQSASDVSAVERPVESRPTPAPAGSERVERLVIERRIKRDHERVMECLTQWSEDRANLDEKTLPALLNSLAVWETAIAQLKQSLQDDRSS